MVNVDSKDLWDLEGHQARTVSQELLGRPVNAAWMDFQGYIFMIHIYYSSLLKVREDKVNVDLYSVLS